MCRIKTYRFSHWCYVTGSKSQISTAKLRSVSCRVRNLTSRNCSVNWSSVGTCLFLGETGEGPVYETVEQPVWKSYCKFIVHIWYRATQCLLNRNVYRHKEIAFLLSDSTMILFISSVPASTESAAFETNSVQERGKVMNIRTRNGNSSWCFPFVLVSHAYYWNDVQQKHLSLAMHLWFYINFALHSWISH